MPRWRKRAAQQHGQRYITRLFDSVEQGDLDPATLITHDVSLEDGVRDYDLFKNKKDNCIRVAMRPGVPGAARHERIADHHDHATARS